jgi:thiosulfate dehydrogenase
METVMSQRDKPAPGGSHKAALFAALSLIAALGCETKSEPMKTSEPGEPGAQAAPKPAAKPGADQNDVDVLLCDGKTTTHGPKGTPGTAIAGSLMTEWLRKNPNSNWEAEERERHTLQPAADNAALVGMVQGQTYGEVTEQDVALWKGETERVALAGSEVFHSGDQLGSTIGVSCDMCHPHAANTHPETYPKYQPQLGRVALLRDMINWCIEHPVRGKALDVNDPKLRALEAYILAQRKGKPLDYGRH